MRKFCIHIILFTVILVALIFIVGQFDHIDRDDLNSDMNIRRLSIQRQSDSLDILFAGSSYVYSGIDPLVFDSAGIRSFNLGTAAAGPYFTQLVVDNYLRNAKRAPKAVFCLLSPNLFLESMDDFKSYPVHRYLQPAMTNAAITRQFSLGARAYAELTLNSFRKGLVNIFRIRSHTPNAASLSLQLHKGFYSSDEITTEAKEKEEAPAMAWMRTAAFSGRKASALMDWAAQLRERGIEPVFFQLPSNKLEQFFSTRYLQSFDSLRSRIAQNYLLLDPPAAGPHEFRNSDHLNRYGAALASYELLRQIDSNSRLRKLLRTDEQGARN
ncbi:MAG: hypothetical protein JO301_11455 [Chitinophagaceae bacterium]|nr:hypothetical protein [Chitinophagaceae bacterium]